MITFPFLAQNPSLTDQRFDAFYEAHADRVFRLCLRLTGNCHAEAEDLAQEVLIAALQSLPRFAGRAQITTWVYTIAVRTYRKRASAIDSHTLALREDEPVGSDSRLERLQVGDNDHLFQLSVAAALAELPLPLREAFVLVKSEGFTHKEAARILELPQGTVQARVHEAARRLRHLLTEEVLP